MVGIFKYINIEEMEQSNLKQVMLTITTPITWSIIYKTNGESMRHLIVHCSDENEVLDEAI